MLSNAWLNLIHTTSHNMITISMPQMNGSSSWGWLAQCHIQNQESTSGLFVPGSELFQTTSQQLLHHVKHIHSVLFSIHSVPYPVHCKGRPFLANNYKGTLNVELLLDGNSWRRPRISNEDVTFSVWWVLRRQKAEKFVCYHCRDWVLELGPHVAGESGVRELFPH